MADVGVVVVGDRRRRRRRPRQGLRITDADDPPGRDAQGAGRQGRCARPAGCCAAAVPARGVTLNQWCRGYRWSACADQDCPQARLQQFVARMAAGHLRCACRHHGQSSPGDGVSAGEGHRCAATSPLALARCPVAPPWRRPGYTTIVYSQRIDFTCRLPAVDGGPCPPSTVDGEPGTVDHHGTTPPPPCFAADGVTFGADLAAGPNSAHVAVPTTSAALCPGWTLDAPGRRHGKERPAR